MHVLTVIHPFGDFPRGHRITDEDEIQTVLKGENAHHCVSSGTPDEVGAAKARAKAELEAKAAEHE